MPDQQHYIKIPRVWVLFALLALGIHSTMAAERWHVVILPDNSQTIPPEVSLYTDINLTITQGLTQVLSAADFSVHNGRNLNLPDCKFADCSAITLEQIREAAQQFNSSLNLALLYQFKAFKQRQNAQANWHFSLAGRLLDLDSGMQLDAFENHSRPNDMPKNCIAECANNWLSQQLDILSQELGAVLADKLKAMPRRHQYELQMQGFSLAELQQTLEYLRQLDSYVGDTLIREYANNTQWLQHLVSRDYQYTSELPSAELGSSLAHFMDDKGMQVNITYQHTQRQFSLQRRAISYALWYIGIGAIVVLLMAVLWRYKTRKHASPAHNDDGTLNQQDNLNNKLTDADISAKISEQSDDKRDEKHTDKTYKRTKNTRTIWLTLLLLACAGFYWRYYYIDLTIPTAALPPLQSEQVEVNSATEQETAAQATPEQLAALQDDNDWQQANRINTLQSYQYYLNRWPEGRYFLSASAALKVLSDDEIAWQMALKEGTTEAYQAYLSDKPDGLYQQRALQRLALLLKHSQQNQKLKDLLTLADDYYYQQKNYVDALYYYQQAAELGSELAQFQLGQLYSLAQGTAQNERVATQWYQQAAKQGHAQAQFKLAYRYSKGVGVGQDHQQAIYWYQQAAEQGVLVAQYNLAYIYAQGQVTGRDYLKAAYWYQQAALQGDADAQNNLGKLYENGQGVEQNITKAKSLYRQAAAQGHQVAKINLSLISQ